ncbi:MAG: heavy metal translocating P-type ATPase, partial [Oscillospiraceae bacterium]|nr:heavy metal translocating P-type ATPase [Oscillospiraceae bacterium]
MVKEFILQDLDCANCAAGIERMIANKPGIRSASVNLATAKLSVEADELGQDELLGTIKEVVKIFEPDVKVIEVAHGRRQVIDASVSKKKLIWIAMGAALFFGGILLEYVLDFAYSGHAAIGLFAVSYFMLGSKVLLRMAQNILKGRVFDENFLMGIATIGAASIGMFAESVAVMLFYRVGEFFQDLAVAKSKKRIGDLMDIRPDYANLKMGDSTIKVDPSSVKVGGIFVVKPGEKVPLDGVVLDGEAMLDTAALTGESVPRKASKDDEVLSGCINSNGVLTIMATKEFGESTVSRILDLVENAANKKAPTETFITKFAAYYTPAVVILAIFLAVAP